MLQVLFQLGNLVGSLVRFVTSKMCTFVPFLLFVFFSFGFIFNYLVAVCDKEARVNLYYSIKNDNSDNLFLDAAIFISVK